MQQPEISIHPLIGRLPYILYIKNASAIHLDNKGEISAVPLCVVLSITNSRMPSAFLLRDARHAMHDIFFCASLQSCRRLYQMGD